jgi:hypothetical protein
MRVIPVSAAMLLAFTFAAVAGGLADRCATKTGATSGAAFSACMAAGKANKSRYVGTDTRTSCKMGGNCGK